MLWLSWFFWMPDLIAEAIGLLSYGRNLRLCFLITLSFFFRSPSCKPTVRYNELCFFFDEPKVSDDDEAPAARPFSCECVPSRQACFTTNVYPTLDEVWPVDGYKRFWLSRCAASIEVRGILVFSFFHSTLFEMAGGGASELSQWSTRYTIGVSF